MTTLALAFIAAVTLLGLIVLFQIERKKTRRRRLDGLELRPNCLLTRYPIAFVSGRKSVFRFFDHWNEIPSYLREHGYEVLLLEPNAKSETQSLLAALDDLGGKCHIVADSSSRAVLERMAVAKHANVISLTLVSNQAFSAPALEFGNADARRARKLAPEDLRPLPSAVEIFEIQTTPLETGLTEQMALLLLKAHNFLVLGRGRFIDALEIAEVTSRAPWALEGRFLELAISLAERDAHAD
jgi:hypothetical protein